MGFLLDEGQKGGLWRVGLDELGLFCQKLGVLRFMCVPHIEGLHFILLLALLVCIFVKRAVEVLLRK